MPLGWQELHEVPKLSSKEVAFFWAAQHQVHSAPNNISTSAPSSGPWIAPASSNLPVLPAEPVKHVQDAHPAWYGGCLAQSLA